MKKGIVAFAFGRDYNLNSNLQIAQIASDTALEQNIPVYTQPDVLLREGVEAEYISCQADEKQPSTLEMARQAIFWAKNQKINNLLVVAAKPHMKRCVRDLTHSAKKIGIKIKIEQPKIPPLQWFYTESKQKHTRSFWQWWSREIILRLLPFHIYKYIINRYGQKTT